MTDNILDGFDELSDKLQSDRRTSMLAAYAGNAQKPEAAARANQLSDRLGKPFGVVADNLVEFEQDAAREEIVQAGNASPHVADFLADPRRMALASDEAPKLASYAKALKPEGEGPQSLLGRTVYSLFGPMMQGDGGRRLSVNLDDFAATVGASSRSVFAAAGEWMAENQRDEAIYAGGADLDDASLARDARLAVSRETALEEERADLAKRAAAARGEADAVVQSYPDNSPGYHTMGVARSLPLMAAAVATRSPSMGAIAIGAGTAADQRSSALADGATPERATASGVVHGTLEGSLDAVTLGIARFGIGPVKDALVRRFGEGAATRLLARASGSAGGRLALATAEGAVTEIPTTLGQMASDEVILGKDYTAADYQRGIRDSAIQGGAMSGGMYAATAPVRAYARMDEDRQLVQVIESADANERLQLATGIAADLRLTERSPADIAAFTEQVAGNEQRVYMPAEQARVLFQSDSLLELVGDETALASQLASGELSVSLSQWMSVVPRLSNRDEILRHARSAVDGLSPAEMESFDPDALAAELGTTETDEAAGRAVPQPMQAQQQIQQDVMGQLVGTGRYSDAAAEAQSKLFASAITTLANRSGIEPAALYERYMAGIRSARADGSADPLATRPFLESGRIDALLSSVRSPDGGATAAEQFGPSLASWLVAEGGLRDQAGELRARDAGKLRPGLVSRNGMPLDTARELAVEAGFISADGDVNSLLDALDGDLRGNPVYSTALGDAARQQFELDRQSLLDAIENTPALRDMPADEFQALTNQQVADLLGPVDAYDQSAAPADVIESEGFREWFGARSVEQLEADYAAIPETDGGRRIDTDLVRELAPAYVADRSLSQQLHPYASRLTKELFSRALARPVAEGRNPIVQFLAGGGGSGKSTATAGAVAVANADIIFDGTLSSLANAQRDVEAALATGRGVLVDFVYRSPENSVEGAIGRAIRKGRPVPVWALAEAHAGAPETVKALAKAYDGDVRVLIDAFWNDGDLGEVRQMPVEEIPDVDRNQAERTFRAAVERAAEEGRAPERLRDAFLASRDQSQDAGSVQGSRPEQSAGNAVTEQTPPTGGVSASGDTFFQRIGDAVRSLFQPKKARGGNRGKIEVFPDRRMAISLFESADRSTFLHETGHFFLEVYRDLAAMPDAPQQVRDDFDALVKWMGVESAEQIGRDQHEQFARGFEHYLAEGRAPSTELQSVFSQFKAWLRGIYQSLRNLNVNLTDEVRGVMDRMLAADEQIEIAQAQQGMSPLARTAAEARALGMSEKQWADYLSDVQQAEEEAKASVLSRMVQSQERALRGWWKQERIEVRAEVDAEYQGMPVFRAARILAGANTLPDGSPMPEGLRSLKLDRAALIPVYGTEYLKQLRGLYAKEGGTDQDLAAAMLGFPSGDALVKALANRGDIKARIEAETDARMLQRHGDPFTDGTLPEIAMDAVHSNRRVRVLERELQLLADLAGQQAPNARMLAAAAQDVIQKTTSRNLRPNEYLMAERKSARQALRAAAAGDYAAALLAKRQQAFNASLFRAARDGQERAESTTRYLRKAASEKTRERVGKQGGKHYVDALDAIFAGHEVGEVSGRQIARRASLRDWVRRMQDEGSSTAVSEALLTRVESENVTNIADMTLFELEQMRETVGNILHLARLKDQLQTAQGQRAWEDAKAEMLERLEEQPDRHGRVGINDADRGVFQRISDLYAAGANWVLQPETVVEWLDGGTSGPFHDLLWNQAQAAERAREALNRKIGKKLEAAMRALPAEHHKMLSRKFEIRTLNTSLSGHSILSALLNMGNVGNRDKLLRGGRVVGDGTVAFTEEQLAEMFSMLTRPQAEMAQKVWDAIDQLWPEIVALEEAMNGITPDRIEAQPFAVVTRDGTVPLRGGYYPAMYDPKGAKAGQLSEDEQAVRVLSGQTPIRASTSKGHTEKRTEFVAPLLLDYQSVLTRHLDGVIGDISYRRFLRQVYKVLGDADIRRMIDNRVGPGAATGLRQSFERGATGNFSLAGPLLGPFQKLADTTMTNVSAAALGYRVPLALANTVAVPLQAAARVKPSYVLKGLRDYYLSGGSNIVANMRKNAEMVQRLSPLMLRRAEARSVEMAAIIANLRGQRGFRAKMIEFGMSMQQWSVPLAENAVWMGAYQQAQAGGADIAAATVAADKAIRQTQTSTSPMELSSAQAGHLRMFMMFAGPLVIMNNRLQEAGLRGLRGDVKSWPQALGVWAAVAVGAVWSFELLMGRGPDDDDDDEKGIADWSAWAAKKLALFPFAAFPILRDAAGALDNGRIRGNPVAEAAVQLYNGTFGLAADLFSGEEVTGEDALKRGTRAAGTVTGIPSNQLLRTGEYFMEVSGGEHVPDNPAAEAYYLLQGPPKDTK